MEIVSFTTDTNAARPRPRVGALLGDSHILDFDRTLAGAEGPAHHIDWFDVDAPWFERARSSFDSLAGTSDFSNSAVVARSSARLLAPVPRPGKLICIGLNYRDHAAELNLKVPERPVVFSKFTTAIIAHGDPVVIPDASQQVDYEAELAVVIGKRAKNVPAARALHYVLGYTVFNDVTARDFQNADGQWQRSKSCDTFAPMGPAIVTTDVVGDPHALAISLTVNGETMQSSNTAQLIFGVPELIEFLSRTITLEPGDVIATGTPPGVGAGRKPPYFLKSGDKMAVKLERIGTLENQVA